jgi:hypothetical protein
MRAALAAAAKGAMRAIVERKRRESLTAEKLGRRTIIPMRINDGG